ncbi:hypothetical protein ACVWZV_001502 [Bradyrhizobium sp. GM5.1]
MIMMISRISSAITIEIAIRPALTELSTRPANAAAAASPSRSRTRSQAGISAAFRAPSLSRRRTTLTS